MPLSDAARAALQAEPALIDTILTGGDDYEILCAIPPDQAAAFEAAARETGCRSRASAHWERREVPVFGATLMAANGASRGAPMRIVSEERDSEERSMAHDDALARRNALVLSGAQALAGANASVVFATGALVGASLGPLRPGHSPDDNLCARHRDCDDARAWLLRTLGRRAAYQYGAAMGVMAGLLAAYAVREGSFALFMLATALCGCYQAFVVNYRFGATDNASPAFRPRAIAWVLAGGLRRPSWGRSW